MSNLRLPFDDPPEPESAGPVEVAHPEPPRAPDPTLAPVEPLAVRASDGAPVDGGRRPLPVRTPPPDQPERDFAVNPEENVVLEASAGTGKTRVLVERYVNLLRKGVEPDRILAITFTRKAAAEMRQRIIERLHEAARFSELDAHRWNDLRGKLSEIGISTIDAFCLSLLREFPLEADVDPGFDMADDTEVPRLVTEALDQTLRICRARATTDDDVALVFAQLGEWRLRSGLTSLLDRRLVAPDVLIRFLARGPRNLTAAEACRLGAGRLLDAMASAPAGFDALLDSGPVTLPPYPMLAADVRALARARDTATFSARTEQAAFRELMDRLRDYFLTLEGEPRKRPAARNDDYINVAAARTHKEQLVAVAPAVREAIRAFRRDLNVVLSRGVRQVYAIALDRYRHTLDVHALLDFPGLLERTLALVSQMDEFARSRYKLESRYHHVLVDEFQDTSRAQWELVKQLVQSWGAGLGVADDALAPSIFVVGDRKQSIYAFRDADVGVFDDAADFIQGLREADGQPTRAISKSFRSTPQLLTFVNDVFSALVNAEPGADRSDSFRYREQDRFPVEPAFHAEDRSLGLVVGHTVAEAADAVADEIVRVLTQATVRDKATGEPRQALAADVGILFRSRDSHREYEAALERRGVPTYVYKGLGFFDADEIQDAVALLRYLAEPGSDLRAAALLRSRTVRLSDTAIAALGPGLASALVGRDEPEAAAGFDAEDRTVLRWARGSIRQWRAVADRLTPAELLDRVLDDAAYAFEIAGPRRLQARENLKKLRALVRRIQNRGYATLQRIADHLEQLMIYDESNAAIDAVDAVSLMTVHAAKGLEFPIVFIVNIGRGASGFPPPIRVTTGGDGEASVAVADYQSEADEEQSDRDREEAKRLLYVALSRARDRLYISGTLKDGVCRCGRGGLGDVMPKTLVALLAEAGRERDVPAVHSTLVWRGDDDREHVFTVCPAASEPPLLMPSKAAAPVLVDDFAPTVAGGVKRIAVRDYIGEGQEVAERPGRPGRGADVARLAGTLAHRLFAVPGAAEPAALQMRAQAWAADLPEAGELDHEALEEIVERAVASVEALRSDVRVARACAGGRALFEVPFACAVDPQTIVRGSIDCVIERSDGGLTVIELKTGAKNPAHEAQLSVYLNAVRTMARGAPVDGFIVYADDAAQR